MKLAWPELVFASVVAAMMAVAVTLPYFTQLDQITTMGDVHRALVYRGVARESLIQQGEIALWEPYLCGGVPLLGNAESAHLDPFFLLVLIFGENLGARLSVTATLIIGFLGAYVLARQLLKAAPVPALLAGALYSFSGFQMLAFANGNFAWIPMGWIPWVILFYLASLRRQIWILPAALGLTFIFLGGSAHMSVYTLLTISLLAVFLSIWQRTWHPFINVILLGMFFVCFSAIKLLPAAEVQALSNDWHRPPPFIQPFAWLPKMFWGRDQLSTPQWTFEATGENFRWIEYGAYIGIIPAMLIALGWFLSWKSKKSLPKAISISSLVLLLMTFAYFPWTLLHQLPFLNEILRNPQRARSVFLLLAGLLAAWALSRLIKSRWTQAIIVTIVLIDLATFHASLYPKLFNLPKPILSSPDKGRSGGVFTRLRGSYISPDEVYYRVGYENYLANQGTTDLCNPYMVQRGVASRGVDSSDPAKPYLGEAWFPSPAKASQGELTVHSVSINGNHIQVAFNVPQETWLYVNQNYFPGWRTNPPREVANKDGLLAARVFPSDHEIEFIYQPRSYQVGKIITFLTLIFAGLCVYQKNI